MENNEKIVPHSADKQLHSPSLAAYSACAWSFIFAAASFYWAAGGTAGAGTISETITELAQSAWFAAVLWGTGLLKALVGILALALVRPWGNKLPRWMLLAGTWGTGILFTFYAGANLSVRGLMQAGIISTPESMLSEAARWHLLLWDPWWLLGGILYIVAAWKFSLNKNSM